MKKLLTFGLASLMCGAVAAQDQYEAANFATNDLNGTARYVGMGGALSALGGDVSTMGSNPAATGIFQRSDVSITLSGVFGNEGTLGHDGSKASFDNAGIVIVTPASGSLYSVNFGVNYTKNKNYLSNINTNIDNWIFTPGTGFELGQGFSQTHQIADLANLNVLNNPEYWGNLADMSAPYHSEDEEYGGILMEDAYGGFHGIPGRAGLYKRSTYGSSAQADLNVSFNVKNRFFYGVSVGLYTMNSHRDSFYQEDGADGHYYDFTNWYDTSGDGVDVKLGFICRPIENSPFRFGVSLKTPTWYSMTDAGGSMLYLDSHYMADRDIASYDYDFRTPWKFGLSLGHTVGNKFAVGAEYEYSDLSSSKYFTTGWNLDSYFIMVNEQIKNMLKGQSTIKIGAEYKVIPELALRLGYNYVSSPMSKDAYKLIGYDSPFTETDYINWGATNRLTFGVGYRFSHGYFDVAYQHSAQKGDLYAFDEVDLLPTKVNNNRSQLLFTLGFKF